MKKPVSKSDLRQEIQAQIRDYLERGGEVEEVPAGTSGRGDDGSLSSFRRLFQPSEGSREPRTPLHDVVIAIEARRRQGKPARPPQKKVQARRKPVLDDFGEPVRWVWVEED